MSLTEETQVQMKLFGQNITNITAKRKDRDISLITGNNLIRIHDEVVPIDPMLLFQRIRVTKQNDEDLQKYLEQELAPLFEVINPVNG